MRLADSHCHLNYKGLVEQQAEVLARARESGVVAMLNISTRESEWDDVIAAAEREADVWATVGIHPHEADEHPACRHRQAGRARARIRAWSASAKPGSIIITTIATAIASAPASARISPPARETGLPIIVHTRDAEDDTAAILREEMGKGAFPGVIHCFTASGDFADNALDLGFYISISGIVTFKNAQRPAGDRRAAAARSAADRNRRALPRARAAPGQDRRAGFRGRYLPLPRPICAARILKIWLKQRAPISTRCSPRLGMSTRA